MIQRPRFAGSGAKNGPRGEEVILGMNRYPVFGPLIMFGTVHFCGSVSGCDIPIGADSA